MKNGLVAVLLVAAMLIGAGVGYFAGSQMTMARTSTITTTIFMTTQNFATPTAPYFYVNGIAVSGTLCYSVSTVSNTWNMTANYPWKIQNGTAYPPPVRVEYTFAPFPLNGSIPAWLQLSMQPPYVTLAGGQNSTSNLELTLDSTVQNGQTTNFAVHAYYNDPISGSSVMSVIELGVVVNGSSTSLYDCSHPIA